MLRDDKPTIPSPNTWSLLGGREEEGETPEQTLHRELKEEANIDQSPVKFLWQEDSDQDGVKDGRIRYYYLLKLTPEQLPTIKLGDEGQKLGFFTIDELKKIPLTWRMNKLIKEETEKITQLLEQ